MTHSPQRFKCIACEVLYREVCHLAARSRHLVDVEFLAKGLHDLPTDQMAAKVQQHVDAADAEDAYDAILLAYARCNDGLVGVTARTRPLVIPKAHDCITLFLGSRQAYRDYFDSHPGTYFHTTGWIERNNTADGQLERPAYDQEGVMAQLGLTESYEEMVAKHGKENADYIIETLGGWEKAYRTLCYIEMGVCDESRWIEASRKKAAEHGWDFERQAGSLSLLERLLDGAWDDDFVIVQPGQSIQPRNDDNVLGVD